MNQGSSFNLWKIEQEFLKKEAERSPELFVSPPQIDDGSILRAIGISTFPAQRPLGYLRLWPQDFIVEEITKDNAIHSVERGPFRTESQGFGDNFSADLVKAGANTLDALDDLAKALKIERRFIGFGGMKDQDALTSQMITFRKTDPFALEHTAFEHFFLKNVRRAPQWMYIGGHQANLFTLTIRTDAPLPDTIERDIRETERNGFWNFYYIQRFGTPRLIDHFLGKFLLQGNYGLLLKHLFSLAMKRELPYLQELRKKLEARFGNWQEMRSLVEPLPYTFRREIVILNHLISHPQDFVGALGTMPEVVKIWAIAYASFLFNQALSIFIEKDLAPEYLPLVLSPNEEARSLYAGFLERDSISFPSPAFADFPFILQAKEQNIATRVRPWISHVATGDNMLVTRFSLPRGAYATTFLAHFLTLQTGLPIPHDIPHEAVDAKQILAIGDLTETLKFFGGAIVPKYAPKENQAAPTEEQ